MKTVFLITRLLLGLIFLVFGLNGFLNFIPMPPPTGIAAQYIGALFVSHYLVPIFLLQVIGGIMLLANLFVPLALLILGPIVVNIGLFHIFMAPAGLPLAALVTILWLMVFFGGRSAFAGVFALRVKN